MGDYWISGRAQFCALQEAGNGEGHWQREAASDISQGIGQLEIMVQQINQSQDMFSLGKSYLPLWSWSCCLGSLHFWMIWLSAFCWLLVFFLIVFGVGIIEPLWFCTPNKNRVGLIMIQSILGLKLFLFAATIVLNLYYGWFFINYTSTSFLYSLTFFPIQIGCAFRGLLFFY